MKAWKRVLCILLALVVLAAAAVGIWQWDNLKPYLMGKLLSEETLAQKMDELLDQQKKKLEDRGVTVDGLTQEQVSRLLHGEADEQTIRKELLLDRYSASDTSKAEELLNACVAQLYGYEAQMYAQLGEVWADAKAAWLSVPKAQRTSALKNQIKSDSISRCYSMEVDADNLVTATLDEYRAKIAAAGGDTDEVDALWNLYCAKKASVKAYYYNLIKDKGAKKG